ncbi:C4-dicarboxylate transporter DctA [Granulicella sp. L46]|uniref:C4-dicarboxylate transporter DctA n=1 Tax=Granulicella sp. L46 TaxID=1641865 RepID=UPI0020B127FF|nr:C4-dicarboxylate transporter DctA [Granulicella sp. L46]
MSTPVGKHVPFLRSLSFRVLVGLILGSLTGFFFPHFGTALQPLGTGFIKLIRMMIGPLVFLTVVTGIAGMSDMKKLGRVGLKALVYFEVVTTFALGIGYFAAKVFHPGSGLKLAPTAVDTDSVAQYAAPGQHKTVVDLLMNIIPDTFVGAFTNGEILEVLFIAILVGIAILSIPGREVLLKAAKILNEVVYKIINIVMEAAPVGAFGAMAFTIGRYGLVTVVALGKVLLCVYGTSLVFIFFVLGGICLWNHINLFKLVSYLREEIFIVLGTSSSEPALPGLMRKLEAMGCSRTVTGLVVPAGYSFNLDGTSIYLTVSALFLVQATGSHLTIGQEVLMLLILMVNSKGAAAVVGGGFITLAATLTALGSVPVTSIALLLGIDRFMSQCRSITNLIGNAVATITIARSENEFQAETANRVMNEQSDR